MKQKKMKNVWCCLMLLIHCELTWQIGGAKPPSSPSIMRLINSIRTDWAVETTIQTKISGINGVANANFLP